MKFNLIKSKVDRKNKRLYACGQVGIKDQELLVFLRQKVPFRIIMYLLFPGLCSKTELAKDLGVYPSIIDFHLKKLLDADIIKSAEGKNSVFISPIARKSVFLKKPVGREIFYVFKNREILEDVHRLLITYKNSMMDPSIVNAYYEFVEEWNHLCRYKKPKKYFCFNSTIDNFINILEEILYFPFHF
jgi:DNA-binding transcriptional ArsR family regulator